MEIIAIESSTFNLVKEKLNKFFDEIEKLCNESHPKDKWLDNQDVCEILKISKRTLQYYRDCGKLSFSQISGKCYYKTSDVEMLLKESETRKS